jgi:hypothetical protein
METMSLQAHEPICASRYLTDSYIILSGEVTVSMTVRLPRQPFTRLVSWGFEQGGAGDVNCKPSLTLTLTLTLNPNLFFTLSRTGQHPSTDAPQEHLAG